MKTRRILRIYIARTITGESNVLAATIAGLSLFIMGLVFVFTYDMLSVAHDTITKPIERLDGYSEDIDNYIWSLIVTTVDGKKVLLSSLKNRTIVFWLTATWCEECVASGRYLVDLSNRYDISVIAVGVWTVDDVEENMSKGRIGIYPPDSSIKLSKFLKSLGAYTWYGVMDYGKELRKILDIYDLNSFIVIDGSGKVIYRGKGINDLISFEHLILKR